MFHSKRRLVGRAAIHALLAKQVQIAANHHLDDIVVRNFLHVARVHVLSVFENGHAVAYAKNFAEPVAHVDDAKIPAAQILNQFEEALRLLRGKRRGRLVKRDYLQIVVDHGAHDLNQLFMPHAEVPNRIAHIQRGRAAAKLGLKPFRFGKQCFPVDNSKTS